MTKKQTDIKQIQELQNKVQELESNWKRALADYKNLETRIEKQRGDIVRMSTAPLLLKLLSVLDHLNLAAIHHPDQEWVRLIRDQLRDILIAEGIEEISVLGTMFDPNVMEGVEQVDGEKDTVMKVLEPGYKQGDWVLRHAKVEVGNGVVSRNTERSPDLGGTKSKDL